MGNKFVTVWCSIIDRVTAGLGAFAGIYLCALVLLTTTDVILRALFKAPIQGTVEITELSMVFIATIFIAYTQKMKGHIMVEIFTEKMSKKWQTVILLVGYILGLCFSFLIVWRTIAYIIRISGRGRTSLILHIPSEIPLICICIGFAMYFLVTINSILEITGVIKVRGGNHG